LPLPAGITCRCSTLPGRGCPVMRWRVEGALSMTSVLLGDAALARELA
jgi:hypothetical protein